MKTIMNPTLPAEHLAELKPMILAKADAFVDRAKRMVEGKFTARELECLWAGALEWDLFVRSLVPLNSEERHFGTQNTIVGKLFWMADELRQQIDLARANPIRVVVGIDGGKFRGASASHQWVKVEAFDWDSVRESEAKQSIEIGDEWDAAESKFAKATKGLVVLC